MPHLDAAALETDPNGTALLRSVLDTGFRGRSREFEELLADEDEPLDFGRALAVEIDRETEAVPLGLIAAASA
jgi:hypothetical protein